MKSTLFSVITMLSVSTFAAEYKCTSPDSTVKASFSFNTKTQAASGTLTFHDREFKVMMMDEFRTTASDSKAVFQDWNVNADQSAFEAFINFTHDPEGSAYVHATKQTDGSYKGSLGFFSEKPMESASLICTFLP